MRVYSVLLVAILLLGWLFCVRKPNRIKDGIYLTLILGAMWFLATFRSGIGYDYGNYISIANEIAGVETFKGLLGVPYEPGFVLLTKLITRISGSAVFLYGVYAAITLIPIGIFIFRQCKDVWLSMWLYVTLAFFYTNMNFMRQSIACAVFVLGYDFLRKKKIIPYMLITLLAASFHKTVLIMIPIYFLVHITLNRKIIIGYAIAVVTAFVLSEPLINLITTYVFKNYKGSYYVVNGFSPKFLLVPVTALIICISLYFTWKERDKDAPMLLNMTILSSTFWLFSMRHMVVERFSMYNYIFLLVALPSALRSLKASPKMVEERDKLALVVENSRAKPRQQDTAGLEKLNHEMADRKIYYWSAVAALLFITLIYNSFGMHVNGFHQVFPYQSVLSWMNFK